jgi:hypothetical protein
MKEAGVNYHISLDLMRFIRDSKPTEEELLRWLGAAQQGRYYILRKAGVLVISDSVIQLSPKHSSHDGRKFRWEICNTTSMMTELTCFKITGH